MVDLQSGLRAVSGGVDYAEGILKGVEFGRHELVGVLADMDFTGRDAIDAGLVFKEDARRDMARIQVPVTWIHGEHDAWIDINRVREVLAAGASSNRRLIQVPTGHQLRTSREALTTFELVASEAVRMIWSRDVIGKSPLLRTVDRIREAESRRRRSKVRIDLRRFWRDYLLGREGLVGMDLLTSTSTYRDMMRRQIDGLALDASSRVLDLGSGTGALERELEHVDPRPDQVVSLDIVLDALKRSSGRFKTPVSSTFVQADLDGVAALPFVDSSLDAVLASLLISYLSEPSSVVREIMRVLRPGGRVVMSTLRRDADISAIYFDGVAELVAAVAEALAVEKGVAFAELQRSFLNEAAKLLDLEEQGLFRFYDEGEFASLARDAGFRVVSVEPALGTPPQAIVLTGVRA
jgi:ubiquinone/menaquinone biosynthesis C-methylase UbiE